MPKIIDMKRTGCACPSQWEGITDDLLYVYIRFRWGKLTIGEAETMEEAYSPQDIKAFVPCLEHTHYLEGFLTNKEMIQAITTYTDFTFDASTEAQLICEEVIEREQIQMMPQKKYLEILQCQECYFFSFLYFDAVNHGICRKEKREISLEQLPFPSWCPLETATSILMEYI